MTAIASKPIDVNEVLNALEVFINKRPCLEFGNYGELKSYRAEMRSIAKDKKRAIEALAAVRRSTSQDAALLADALQRSFSGRLEWHPAGEPDTFGDYTHKGHLEYTTGQYFPTEYRKAAASVLEEYKRALNQKWATETGWKPAAFQTMADVKAANELKGGCWFSRGNMRFFSSRIESKLLTRGSSSRQFFITSECSGIGDARRMFTIREVTPEADIRTYGEFQGYRTLQAARDAVTGIA